MSGTSLTSATVSLLDPLESLEADPPLCVPDGLTPPLPCAPLASFGMPVAEVAQAPGEPACALPAGARAKTAAATEHAASVESAGKIFGIHSVRITRCISRQWSVCACRRR